MRGTLPTLPPELLFNITAILENSQDVLNLARTCKPLWYTLDHLEIFRKDARYQLAHADDFRSIWWVEWDATVGSKWNGDLLGFHRVNLGGLEGPHRPILHWSIKNVDDIGKIEELVDIFQKMAPTLLEGMWNPIWPSPLATAVAVGRLDVVELLVSKGCSVHGNRRAVYGRPSRFLTFTLSEDPLLVACSLGHETIANFLIDNGAQISECHIAHAGTNRMISTLRRLLDSEDFRQLQQDGRLYGWLYPAFRMAICWNRRDVNKEVIDMYVARLPELSEPRNLEYAVWDAFTRNYIENANYLFQILVKVPTYSPFHSLLLASHTPKTDKGLVITKLLHEHYGSQVFIDRWSLTQHMLLTAIKENQGDDSNAETINFLLNTGCKLSRLHVEAALKSMLPQAAKDSLVDRISAALGYAWKRLHE